MKHLTDSFEKSLAMILFFCGVISNSIGLVTSLLKRYPSETAKIINCAVTGLSLAIIIFVTVLYVFILKKYIIYNFIVTSVTAFVLFPFMFITTGNISGSFVFYLFIIATAYGVSIRKAWQLSLPFIALGFYIFLFALSFKGILPSSKKPSFGEIQLYSGFISTYLFIVLCTYYVTKITLASRQAYIELSSRDELTKLYNRRSLDNDLDNGAYKFGIMVDIDNFKHINDTYGHPMGDEVLRKLAEIVLSHCTNEFKIYRYGGEEFFIISRFDAKDTFFRIKDIYNNVHANLKVLDDNVTISCGIAENIGGSIEDFIAEADAQLYMSKHNGKDQATFMGSKLDF